MKEFLVAGPGCGGDLKPSQVATDMTPGFYVPAEVAQRLHDELTEQLNRLDYLREQWGDEGFSRTAADRMRAALKFADEYGGGSDEL